MRTLVNFRVFWVVAGYVLCSVLCALLAIICRPAGIVIGCALIATAAIGTAYFIFLYVKGKSKLRFSIAFGLSLILSIISFSIAVTFVDGWSNGLRSDGSYTVSGRVCAVDIRDGKYKLIIEDLVIGGRGADGKMTIDVRANDLNIVEHIDCGDRISFNSYISGVKLYTVKNGINGKAYRSDIRYNSTVDGDGFSVSFGTPTFFEKILSSFRSLLSENMGEHYGNIAFSMLTGDKYALDRDVTDYFSAVGLGHIMAVSGLHIGFLAIVLSFIFSRLDKKISFPITSAILLLYAALAGFSPSVVRAVIMALISGAAVFVGGRRDILSSLLCAFSLILAFRPYYLFEFGFIFSFGSIFGIAMFANLIRFFLEKHGAHSKVANAVGASASAAVGILPVQFRYFGGYNFFAILYNSILIPYISVVFILTICFIPIAAIPGCESVLIVCKYALMPLDYIAFGLAHVQGSWLSVSTSSWVFLCYPVMFCASGYFMSGKIRPSVTVCAILTCILIVIVSSL